MSLNPGTRLGPYQILAPIGAGGMGEVYRALDTRLGREVAVKVLPEHLTRDSKAVARFEREARAVAALSHPNIVALYDVGSEGGVSFAVTELLEGETLRGRLGAGALALEKAIEVGAAVAKGLAAAHAKGFTHRDLKPENIFLTRDGRVKILDFGLALYRPARPPEEEALTPTETEPGTVLGTVGYMSPEQVRGQAVGPTSDLFSLGCVLYEMVTGRRAFARATPGETMAAILRDEAPAPAIHAELDRLMARCLEKDPEQRFQSARDLAFDLSAIRERKDRRVEPRRWGLLSAAAGALLALGGLGWWWGTRGAGPIDSLAVLPFVNASGDPNTEYLSEGISESLITSLSRLPRLKVKPRDTVFRYKGKDRDFQELGRELGVRALLKGRLAQRGESLSISVELVDTSDGTLLWREQYSRRAGDLLSIEQEISKEISRQLRLKLSGEEQRRMTAASTRNTEAHQLYLQGRYHWNRRTEEALKKSTDYFQQAIERDPGHAQAWAGLADSYNILGLFGWMPIADAFPRARAAATRAIEMEEALAEPHASLAILKTTYEWDWRGAEREFQRAIELNPDYSTAHHWYAWYLLVVGRLPEALAEIRRARDLEPHSPIINANLGFLYYYNRQYEQSVQQARRTIEMDPALPRAHLLLGAARALQGNQKEAVAGIEQALRLSQRGLSEFTLAGPLYALLGQRQEAQKLFQEWSELSRKKQVGALAPAMIYASLGERDRAIEYFEKALQDRSLFPWYLRDPLLDGIRTDPRFQKLLERMGLPP